MRRTVLAAPLLAFAVLLASPPPVEAGEGEGPTLTVIGARVNPIKAKGKAWDADHGAIPFLVYHQLGGLTGFPPLTLLSLVPYRNRPDPYVIVEGRGQEIDRSSSIQGTFAPTWLLEVDAKVGKDAPSLLTFRVLDDDLRKDDPIGKAMVDLDEVLKKPGLHTVEGTGGLFDLSFVVRNPGAPGAGPITKIKLRKIHVTVKRLRPAGGEWDAGGNPLARRFPKLKIPKDLEGLPTVRPDPILSARWSAGGAATSEMEADVLEVDWDPVGLDVVGRKGVGDGLFLTVTDEDLALADPVGAMHIPFEDFLARARKGTLEVKGDELSGIEKVVITFTVQ